MNVLRSLLNESEFTVLCDKSLCIAGIPTILYRQASTVMNLA